MQFVSDTQFYKHLYRLTIPIFFQQVLRISVDTINSIMLGSIDQIQMSAVSQANQIFFIYYAICNGVSIACCVLVAQHWGKKDYESISLIVAHALRAITIFGVIVTVMVFAFPELFMKIYSSDPQIIAIGATHLRRVSLMYVACGISVILLGSCRGMEQVKIILATNIVTYAVNIFLDYVLIFGKFGFPKLGILGVAIGTIVARFVELTICSLFFFREPDIPVMFKDLRKSDNNIRRSLIKVSIPIVAHDIIWSLGTSSGAMITGQLGKSAVAGYNVTTVLYDLLASLPNGYLNAANVVIGMTLGKGESEEAKKQAHSIMAIALAMGIVIGLIAFGTKDLFLSLYSLDPQAVIYARQFITIIAIVFPFALIEMVTMVSILRAGGDGKVGFYTDIVVMWLICIPLASYCAFKLHSPPWVVVAIIKTIVVLEAIIGFIRVLTYKWVNNLTTK